MRPIFPVSTIPAWPLLGILGLCMVLMSGCVVEDEFDPKEMQAATWAEKKKQRLAIETLAVQYDIALVDHADAQPYQQHFRAEGAITNNGQEPLSDIIIVFTLLYGTEKMKMNTTIATDSLLTPGETRSFSLEKMIEQKHSVEEQHYERFLHSAKIASVSLHP